MPVFLNHRPVYPGEQRAGVFSLEEIKQRHVLFLSGPESAESPGSRYQGQPELPKPYKYSHTGWDVPFTPRHAGV
mgnify:CR=1 FL=1